MKKIILSFILLAGMVLTTTSVSAKTIIAEDLDSFSSEIQPGDIIEFKAPITVTYIDWDKTEINTATSDKVTIEEYRGGLYSSFVKWYIHAINRDINGDVTELTLRAALEGNFANVTVTQGENAVFTIDPTQFPPGDYEYRWVDGGGGNIVVTSTPTFTVTPDSPHYENTRFGCAVQRKGGSSHIANGYATLTITGSAAVTPPPTDTPTAAVKNSVNTGDQSNALGLSIILCLSGAYLFSYLKRKI